VFYVGTFILQVFGVYIFYSSIKSVAILTFFPEYQFRITCS